MHIIQIIYTFLITFKYVKIWLGYSGKVFITLPSTIVIIIV